MSRLLITITGVFIALKLADILEWGWILVLSPLWGGALAYLILSIFVNAFFSGPYR